MKTQLDKIEHWLEVLTRDNVETKDNISEINITQAEQKIILSEQAKQLEYHIKRTDIAEERIDSHEKTLWMMKGVLYTLSIMGTILTIAAAVWQAYKS